MSLRSILRVPRGPRAAVSPVALVVRAPIAFVAAGVILIGASGGVCRAFAQEPPSDELNGEIPSSRLGLSALNDGSRGLLGFIDRERLSHSRSLSLGYATTTGEARRQHAAAAYTDVFGYQMRENLRLGLALQYRFETASRTLRAESGDFSVLPSFALEYTPSENSVIRLSYGRCGQFGGASPFALRSSVFPY